MTTTTTASKPASAAPITGGGGTTSKPARPLSAKQLQAKADRLAGRHARLKEQARICGDELTSTKIALKEAKEREKEAAKARAMGTKNGAVKH